MAWGRLWTRLTCTIITKEVDVATEAKTMVEDAQCEAWRNMDEHSVTHVPRFFHLKDSHWVPKLACVTDPFQVCSSDRTLRLMATLYCCTVFRLPMDLQDAEAAMEKVHPPSYIMN